MTLDAFLHLVPRAQLLVAVTRGTHLARRWNKEGRVNLYHLAGQGTGFFVELGYTPQRNEIVVLRGFTSSSPLACYLRYLPLPQAAG